jgi:aryl-alcohol dehydrogenase-like predicted oxidoreductase
MTTRRGFLASVSGLAFAPLVACSRKPSPEASTSASPGASSPATDAEQPPPANSAARAAAAQTDGSMLTRPIPSSGERVPVIGAGTSGSYEVPLGSPEHQKLSEAIKVFFSGGGTLLDTSPNYSNAEDVVGALLEQGGYRARCFLATKLAADSRQALEAQWADSLKRLKTDKVELLQVHNLRNLAQSLPYARELKAQGLVKYVGITHYLESGHADLVRLMREEKLDFVQVNYAVNAPRAAERVLPTAQERGVAVLVNRAFDDGKLFAKVRDRALPGWATELGITSWAQLFLKFAISHPAVTAVIPATGKPERQADNLRAGSAALLSTAQQAELTASFA